MKRYKLPINLAELMAGGYEPKAGDVVYDTGYNHLRTSPIVLTGTRHKTYADLIGHSTRYESTPVDYHLPKFYEQYRDAVLVNDVINALKNALTEPNDYWKLKAVEVLLDTLKKDCTHEKDH